MKAPLLLAVLLLPAVPLRAQITERTSLSSGALQGNADSGSPQVTPDGRYVVFESRAGNLVPNDTNGQSDVFVRDRLLDLTERVSVATGGGQGNGLGSFGGAISPDGRYVVFKSHATNLVAGDTNGVTDVFLRDRQSGTTERASVDSAEVQGNGNSDDWTSVSSDGRYVTFTSLSTNLVAGDTNGLSDVFQRDRTTGTTERLSISTGGIQANGSSYAAMVSATGRYIVFLSAATNLVTGDTNGAVDVFVRDRHIPMTQRVSIDSGVNQGNGGATNRPSISSDGRYIEFDSVASNLVAGDTNALSDVFLRDRTGGTTRRVSVGAGGVQGNGGSHFGQVSADGQHVVFSSFATNLVPGDANGQRDVFVHDVATSATFLASTATAGAQANGASDQAASSAAGQFVVFESSATNLVPGDTNTQPDVFVRDRGPAGFTSLCSPGVAGVIGCPCSNPPSATGRGCDNSSGTGGAVLYAAGIADLSADNLVFATSGERPTALSIVAQWIGSSATGAVFGMGVRCTSGTFERLYNKIASGGSITAPDFAAGDASVSAQSAAKGDVILGGQSRWYVVYYRDPNVLGGCPSTSNFNATQTGRVTWVP